MDKKISQHFDALAILDLMNFYINIYLETKDPQIEDKISKLCLDFWSHSTHKFLTDTKTLVDEANLIVEKYRNDKPNQL